MVKLKPKTYFYAMLHRVLILLLCLPLLSTAQDTEMPFRPEGDSLIPFEQPVKSWYVQTLEEVHKELRILKTTSPKINVLVYITQSSKHGPEYHYVVAQQQKYSWKLAEFELGYDYTIDTAYLKEIDGKGQPELVIGWRHWLGASGQDFSWEESLKGICIYQFETSRLILKQTTFHDENHYGSSANETLLENGTGIDAQGRFILKEDEQRGVEMKYRQEIIFAKGSMTILIKALDPNDPNRIARQWPDVRYAYTEQGWKKIH